jgi:pyruvate/2-oxoglutarate dehydrogenase complex dihydrolipoamide acyltransferase (E2) component
MTTTTATTAVTAEARMTNHVVRLYAFACSLLVLFAMWAAIAARPWATSQPKADPRWAAFAAREQRVRQEAVVVQRVVARRWHAYRVRLAVRRHEIAAATQRRAALASAAPAPAAPSVRVVSLPPVTVTRTS